MRSTRSIVALALVAVALPLAAEGQKKQPPQSAITVPKNDSLDVKASPELQQSLEQLGQAVQALALRIANDPELRAAALHVATGFVNTAQQVVAENSTVIEEALKTAAERIASAETRRKAQSRLP